MNKAEQIKLYKVGGALIAALAWLVYINKLTTAEAISITLVSFLVFATFMYAKRTAEIADATKEQAREVKEQRLMASRPIIAQKAVYEKDIWEGSTKDYFSHFEISSVGNTTAIEVEISLMDKKEGRTHSIRQTFLRADDPPIKFRPYNIANLEESKTFYVVCEYQDVFSHYPQKTFCKTRLPFKISKSSEKDKIYVVAGELEFCEVSEKDRIDAFSSRSKPQ